MSEMGVDAVWVGTFAGLNEGDMRGGWLELPYEEETLGTWLREVVGVGPDREEYGVFDTDFRGPLGEIGLDVCAVTRLEALNTLALLAEGLDEWQVEAVRALASYEGATGAVELGNLIAQVAEVPRCCRRLPAAEGYSSQEERLGYALVGDLGGLDGMGDAEVLANLDYASYGREMLDDGLYALGGGIYVDIDASEPSTDLYRGEELADLAQGLAPIDGGDARAVLMGAGCPPREVEFFASDHGEEALRAAAAIVSSLPADKLAALALWAREGCSPVGPLEVTNAALDVDRIDHAEIPDAPGPLEERMGIALADRFGVSREEAEAHFDYERYGRDALASGGIAIEGDLYLETDGPWPDLRRYDMAELRELAIHAEGLQTGPRERNSPRGAQPRKI